MRLRPENLGLFVALGLIAATLSGCAAKNVWQAARNGNRGQLKDLLENDPSLLNAPDKNGWAPLLWATSHGHKNTVELLLKKGADPTVRASAGHTALKEARAEGHLTIEKMLLEALEQRGEVPKRY